MKIPLKTYSIGLLIGVFFIDCIAGAIKSNLNLTTPEKIKKEGYNVEEHTVVTADGYWLTMHRIPGREGAPAVFVQHGLLCSSYDWVIAGRNKSLAFILADRGFDVWLGNARGNTYSRRHSNYTTSDPRFWNFSWHEMGVYDLPAVITYITDLRDDKLFYVGHSMGTTMFYVMAIENPEVASKVKVMFSFAPVAYMYHWTSPTRLLTDYADKIENFFKQLKMPELLPQSSFIRFINKYLCDINISESNACLQMIFITAGYNPSQFNYSLITELMNHVPAGTSVRTLLHYLQIGKEGNFRKYDHKLIGNIKAYNSVTPPAYNLSKIEVPIGIFWSDNDIFAAPQDVRKFYDEVPNIVLNYRIPHSKFTHTDFMWAMNAPELLYSKLITAIDSF